MCTSSLIKIHHSNEIATTIYDSTSTDDSVAISTIQIDRATYKELKIKELLLQTERYISDVHFYKEGTFYHRFLNSDHHHTVIVQV